MSDLVGNPEDRFSHNEAHLFSTQLSKKFKLLINIEEHEIIVGILTFMIIINDWFIENDKLLKEYMKS